MRFLKDKLDVLQEKYGAGLCNLPADQHLEVLKQEVSPRCFLTDMKEGDAIYYVEDNSKKIKYPILVNKKIIDKHFKSKGFNIENIINPYTESYKHNFIYDISNDRLIGSYKNTKINAVILFYINRKIDNYGKKMIECNLKRILNIYKNNQEQGTSELYDLMLKIANNAWGSINITILMNHPLYKQISHDIDIYGKFSNVKINTFFTEYDHNKAISNLKELHYEILWRDMKSSGALSCIVKKLEILKNLYEIVSEDKNIVNLVNFEYLENFYCHNEGSKLFKHNENIIIFLYLSILKKIIPIFECNYEIEKGKKLILVIQALHEYIINLMKNGGEAFNAKAVKLYNLNTLSENEKNIIYLIAPTTIDNMAVNEDSMSKNYMKFTHYRNNLCHKGIYIEDWYKGCDYLFQEIPNHEKYSNWKNKIFLYLNFNDNNNIIKHIEEELMKEIPFYWPDVDVDDGPNHLLTNPTPNQ